MTNPHDLERGDDVRIDTEPLTGVTFRVSDAEVEDIGITETFAVSLVSDAESIENFTIVGTTADSTATLEAHGSDESYDVMWRDIKHVN